MLDAVALQQENAALRAQVAALVESIARLNERVTELLAVAQRKQRKPSPVKAPEAPPSLEGDERQAFESRPKPPELPQKSKEKKPRPPPTGRKALPTHLPVDAHHLEPDACLGHCGSTALDAADVDDLGCLATPVGDDLTDLFLADEAPLDALRVAAVAGQQEHVALADQLLGAGLVEDDSAVGE